MGLHEVLLVKVSVNLSGGDVGMSEELLNDPQVGLSLIHI